MAARHWLWIGTMFDLLLFVPASYMAVGAVGVARANMDSVPAVGIAFLFLALPVFALAGPMSAWRAHGRGHPGHAASLMLAPIVYAAFLVLLLIFA